MHSIAWATGGLATLGALAFALAVGLHGLVGPFGLDWPLSGAVLASGMVTIGGLACPLSPRWGRTIACLGLLAWMVQAAAPLTNSPALVLFCLLIVTGLSAELWKGRGCEDVALPVAFSTPLSRATAAARASSYVALATWFLVVVGRIAPAGPLAFGAVAASLLISYGFAAGWLFLGFRHGAATAKWFLVIAAAGAGGAAVSFGDWPSTLTWAACGPAALLILAREGTQRASLPEAWWGPVIAHPARLLVLTFLGLSLLGAVALAVPACAARGYDIRFIDAAFTAVSAVCVTGLIVVDTPTAYSLLGQCLVLLLIQLGGLGIMSFSTAALAAMRRRLSLRHEGAVAGLLSGEDRGDLFSALRRLLWVTFSGEALGACVLCGLFFMEGDAPTTALWRGVFTSISAFCNAGFALQSANLIAYQESGLILHTVAALIIAGGLSPAVVAALPALLLRRKVGLQVRLAVTASVFLLVAGTVLILAFEWTNTLSGLPILGRLNNAWFQSVTLRTAGFNSVDISAVRPATITVMLAMMFIGGSPGGTAGGIKTTTAAVLLLAIGGALKGRSEAVAFGRLVPHRTVYNAAAVATVGILAVTCGLIAIQLTQAMPTKMALFEVVSALGTVGLSIGGTAKLDAVGKVIIMACMFAGRVGPLTLFLFLRGRRVRVPSRVPEEKVEVG